MPDSENEKPLWEKLRPKPPTGPPVEPPAREMKRFQALQMMLERMAGAPLDEIAKNYQTLRVAPDEKLTDERKQEIRDEFERLAFERLAPLVMAVYEANLKMGSVEAARDVGLSLGILKKPITAPPKVTIIQPEGARPINSIDDYRLERQTRAYKVATPKRLGGDSVS
jgi:hypothetical protein